MSMRWEQPSPPSRRGRLALALVVVLVFAIVAIGALSLMYTALIGTPVAS